MVTRESLLTWVEKESNIYFGGEKPIYSILLFEYPDKQYMYEDGKESGFPDLGANNEIGYYHSLEHAIDAMNVNNLDMREETYNAGFILCRFPGLYNSVGHLARMYFVWNDDEGGFFQAEEPEIFEHMVY